MKRTTGREVVSLAADQAAGESSDPDTFTRALTEGFAIGIIGTAVGLYAVKRFAQKQTIPDFNRV